MTIRDLLETVGSNTASAATWAALAWLYLAIRNRSLERKLRRSMKNHGLSSSRNGVGILLSNPTNREVIVRGVSAIQGDAGSVRLNYEGPKEECDHRTFVTLPPFSEATWYIPPSFKRYLKGRYTAVKVEFLYPTLFGEFRRCEVMGDKRLIDDLNLIWENERAE